MRRHLCDAVLWLTDRSERFHAQFRAWTERVLDWAYELVR
jgi:hypothetical protein